MVTRIMSTLVGLPVLVGIIIYGNEVVFIAVFLLTLMGLNEFYNAFSKGHKPIKSIGYLFTVVYYSCLYGTHISQFNIQEIINFIFIAFVITLFVVMVIVYPKYSIQDIMITILGFIYISLFFSYIVLVREQGDGNWLVWIIFLSAWGSDTFAYFTGKFLGRHYLVPKLSPRKTVEGAVGGSIGGGILCLVYGVILQEFLHILIPFPLIYLFLLGAGMAILSQFGDLAASAMKRAVGLKDFGSIIPGHGGILDRFDSILFTAPFVYYIYMILY